MKRRPHWEAIKPVMEGYGIIGSHVIHPKSADESFGWTRAVCLEAFNTGNLPAKCAKEFRAAAARGDKLNPLYLMGDHSAGSEGLVFRSAGEWAAYALFAAQGERVFKLAREFGEQLAKVDLKLAPSLATTHGKWICIEFPDSVEFRDGDDVFHCAYVCADRAAPYVVDSWGQHPHMIVRIHFPCYNNRAVGDVPAESNALALTFMSETESIESSLQRAKDRSTHPIGNDEVIRYLLKAIVYIDSGDPDLREYRPPRKPMTHDPKKLRRWNREHADHCKIPMTLVGYNFKKPTVYTVGETTVTGHFRWQPYGAGRERVKLIWIDPHVRHYGAKEEE